EAGETTLPGEPPPADGITDADLLGFSIGTSPSPSRTEEPVASTPAEAGDWPGIEIDWTRPAEASAALSPDEGWPEARERDVAGTSITVAGGAPEGPTGVAAEPGHGAEPEAELAWASGVTADEVAESRGVGDAGADAGESAGAGFEFPVDVDAGAAADARVEIESLTATTPPGFVGIGGRDGDLIDTAPTAIARADIDRPEGARGTGHGAGERATPKGRGETSVQSADRDEDESAIDYFSAGPRGVGFIDRHGPLTLAGGGLLGLVLGLQWTFAQRSMIAARVPALAPVISAVLSPFGLRLELPRDLESLTIESFELQSSAMPGVLAMSALLRNRADYAV